MTSMDLLDTCAKCDIFPIKRTIVPLYRLTINLFCQLGCNWKNSCQIIISLFCAKIFLLKHHKIANIACEKICSMNDSVEMTGYRQSTSKNYICWSSRSFLDTFSIGKFIFFLVYLTDFYNIVYRQICNILSFYFVAIHLFITQ